MSSAAETITVSRRFNGPQESGNGGYSSGLIANHLDGPVEVSLRSPVPLDDPLDVIKVDEVSLLVRHQETLVAEARSVPEIDVAVPAPVGLEEAGRASQNYRAAGDGLFSSCFVCGPAREDSFGVFAGQVEGRKVVATPWTPPAWTAEAAAEVRPEFVWAVLDCPTYFACHLEQELTLSMLVRQSAEVRAPILAGEDHIVMAWPIELEGRKRLAGAAVLSPGGEILAVAEVLLIEPRAASAAA
ncbi:MAG TPA: hypothetical protein VH275_11335 [Solirubrobacterales bacterium]|jgi:hypothetical protein|nr:hypothetical protein [Solirubrobacterales bacterium]